MYSYTNHVKMRGTEDREKQRDRERQRQRDTERRRETEAEREREDSNSKTLFYKDCRLGSVKTCLTTNLV